ncbi:DUF2529 domain-containing protein [Bacillus shivajii]|uniref:DUF2529 family protein n=1 Tax=Bacillus shivajii TaxID=1983719 RepID=UPI001CFAE717|nr:DUF2529 family protein [Bacillus shivajii]UCZ53047.1 DUF2529 domain-containing protein [Bacillus shivajii]
MKIFRTQLQNFINRTDEYEEQFEDAARIIAQSIISDGDLWIYGESELEGIVSQAVSGVDPLPTIKVANTNTAFTHLDTLLVFSTDPASTGTKTIVEKGKKAGCEVIGVSSHSSQSDQEQEWITLCNFHFSTGLSQGLVPTDDGNRIGTPHLLIALHIYYALYFTLQEYLEEYDM